MNASFIHKGGPDMASYRLRAQLIAEEMPAIARINDVSADVLVFSKPYPSEVQEVIDAKARGQRVVVDICDDHFEQEHYIAMAGEADAITCPTMKLADIARRHGFVAEVIGDCYEYPEVKPHCGGVNLLWYGHGSNLPSLVRVMRHLDDYPLMIVSNVPMAMPWSYGQMVVEFAKADIVVLPATAEYKSSNRAVEAIRQGCFVVAEPHPSLVEIPGIWVGDLKEGIEWTRQNLQEANRRIRQAQDHVRERYSPRTRAAAWRSLFERVTSRCTSAAAESSGPDGSMSTASMAVPT